MKDNQAIVVTELRDNLRDLDQKVPIDWTQFDDENLLKCLAILLCWSVDGMIRICGVSEDIQVTDDPDSWSDVIKDVNRRRDIITLSDLAKLHSEGIEFQAVLLLGFFKMQFDRARREVFRRIELRPVGRQVVYWMERFPNFKEQDLLSAFKPPKAITARGKRTKLSDPFRDIPSDRKEMERQSLNVATALEFYEALKTGLNHTSPVDVPFSPIANTYPAKPEIWEKAFPKLIQEQRDAHVAELLRILDGEMEKAPLQGFNAYRNAFRKALSWSAQKGEADASTNEERKAISKIHHDELDRENLDPEHEKSIDRKRDINRAKDRLNAKLRGARASTRPKIVKAIEMYFLKNYSIKDAAKGAKIDEKTLRPYIIELRLSPVRAVSRKIKR
jgi:hypothetical protein